MLQSVIKPATVLFGLGVLGWTAEPAQAQIGYGSWGSPGYGAYHQSHGPGYGHGGYGYGYGGYGGYATEEEFIESLYVNILGRQPERYEVLGWARNVRQLGLPPSQVAWMFRNSTEYVTKHGYGGGYRGYGYTPRGGAYGW